MLVGLYLKPCGDHEATHTLTPDGQSSSNETPEILTINKVGSALSSYTYIYKHTLRLRNCGYDFLS